MNMVNTDRKGKDYNLKKNDSTEDAEYEKDDLNQSTPQ